MKDKGDFVCLWDRGTATNSNQSWLNEPIKQDYLKYEEEKSVLKPGSKVLAVRAKACHRTIPRIYCLSSLTRDRRASATSVIVRLRVFFGELFAPFGT